MKSLFLLVAQALFTSVYSAFYFLVRNTAAFLIISLWRKESLFLFSVQLHLAVAHSVDFTCYTHHALRTARQWLTVTNFHLT